MKKVLLFIFKAGGPTMVGYDTSEEDKKNTRGKLYKE
jgi:hypothetical protein